MEVEQNNNREPRSDYFTLRSGKHTLRVDIKQSNENSSHKAPETETQILTEPMAEIIKVWADYNIYNNSLKGMNIHTKFSTSDEIRKRIYMIIAFYYSDNKSN
ncbi:hypothetical protein [Prevotella herbatica]|uniref:hypothetical protein n=1 Tax=Prevotella herbatica TaxID=2801997 RepID=UPI001A91E7BD|nr:hypothetical protein [Prevotella herbatica]